MLREDKISTSKELSDKFRNLALTAESAIVRAAAASLALQLAPWPTADRTELARWRHSSRLPKAIEAATLSASALATLGFIPGAEWFVTQALKRAELVDYLDEALVAKLQRAKTEVAERAELLVTSTRRGSAGRDEALQSLDRCVSQADAAGCVEAVGHLLSHEVSIEAYNWGFLPQVAFVKVLRDLQEKLDRSESKLDLLEKHSKGFRPKELGFPPDLLLLLSDASGALWAVSRKGKVQVSRRGKFELMAEKLTELLKANKEAVKSAKNVQAFWRERRAVEEGIRSLLDQADDEIDCLVGVLPDSHKIYLGVPTRLCNFPFEALQSFGGKQVVRAVPIERSTEKSQGSGGFGVINPGGDLETTEAVISETLKRTAGFSLTVGTALDEKFFIHGLEKKRNFVYAGHCGGERFFNGSAIQRAAVVANVHLFGCRSAEINRGFSTPWHYLIGNSPSVTAVIWDVLGRDCDRVSRFFLEKILGNDNDLLRALYEARKHAKFPALTGAAFIIYQPINPPS